MARIRPISWVRSPTAIHIMVRMPIERRPASEIPAIAPTARVTMFMTLPKHVEHRFLRGDREVLVAVVARREHAADLALRPVRQAGVRVDHVDLGELR